MSRVRSWVKAALARLTPDRPARGATVLIYHRVGGGSSDERDVTTTAFARHLDILQDRDVVSLDTALHRMSGGDDSPGVVLTFDDGFADVYENAWPLLRDARSAVHPLSRHRLCRRNNALGGVYGDQVRARSSLVAGRGDGVLRACARWATTPIGTSRRTGSTPVSWTSAPTRSSVASVSVHGISPSRGGSPSTARKPMLRTRFRSAATAQVGRNLPGQDSLRLRRIPVRRTDPPAFFRAKVAGGLLPERAYACMTSVAKKVGIRG